MNCGRPTAPANEPSSVNGSMLFVAREQQGVFQLAAEEALRAAWFGASG